MTVLIIFIFFFSRSIARLPLNDNSPLSPRYFDYSCSNSSSSLGTSRLVFHMMDLWFQDSHRLVINVDWPYFSYICHIRFSIAVVFLSVPIELIKLSVEPTTTKECFVSIKATALQFFYRRHRHGVNCSSNTFPKFFFIIFIISVSSIDIVSRDLSCIIVKKKASLDYVINSKLDLVAWYCFTRACFNVVHSVK